MALQSLRNRLKSLERERDYIEECSSSNNTGTLIDQTQVLNQIQQSGNRPEDWLAFLKTMEQQTKDATDTETVKCTFLSNLYSRAMKAVPVELSKDSEAYAQIMIRCANLKSAYNVEDARSVLTSARIFARSFACVHVALAQFELMQGNKDKAARILQKAKEIGAQPTTVLSTAYKNLLLGCKELLSEEDTEVQPAIQDTGTASRGELDKENSSTLESPLELLKPKLSWRLSCKDSGISRQSTEEDNSNRGVSASAKIYTDILKPMPPTVSDYHDSCHSHGLSSKRQPLLPMDRQLSATPVVVPRLGETTPLTMPFKRSHYEEDGTVSFQDSQQKSRPVGLHAVSTSDEADTVPLGSETTSDAHRVPRPSGGEQQSCWRALRSCHSTPDCKNPSVLSMRSSNMSAGRHKDFGRPQRIRPQKCALPQIEEKADVKEGLADDTDNIKLMPMPDLDMDVSHDITIPCAGGAESNSGVDSTGSSSSIFNAVGQGQSQKQNTAQNPETVDCSHAAGSSGQCHANAMDLSTKDTTGPVQQSTATVQHPIQNPSPWALQQQPQQQHPTPQSLVLQTPQPQPGLVQGASAALPISTPSMGAHPQACTPMGVMHTPVVGKCGEVLTVNGKQYLVLKLIGRGGSSKVYEVVDPDSNLRAVKRISLDGADEHTVCSYHKEISLLKRLQSSKKIIKLYDFEYSKPQNVLYIVMERGDTDLASFFRTRNKDGSLSQPLRKFYWSEMLKAVQVLHRENIVHSDLKPANFLLVAGNLKLIDFGIAHALQQDMTSITLDQQVGTVNYMSPEAITGSQCRTSADEHGNVKPRVKIGMKSDVWSLGCILYNLVYGRTPFQHIGHPLLKLQAIINPGYDIKFPPMEEADLLDTMKKCLIRDPKMRPSIDELLQHPYLR